MSDDLDDLIRRAMKTLDDQVPSGYFEGLPNRTLARLGEDSGMQTSSTDRSEKRPHKESSPVGIPQKERDEDSGLHDIRSMASSTKMRLSSKRISTSPPVDEDILASSSAGWKAVALPEPARMVSLPEIPVAEPAKPTKRTSASKLAREAIAVETAPVSAGSPAPAEKTDAPVTPIIGARLAQQKKSKAGLVLLVGGGLAAAAGVGWYVSTQMGSSPSGAGEQVALSSSDREAPAALPPAAPPAQTIAAPSVVAAEPAADAVDTTVATGMADEKSADDDGATSAAATETAKPRARAVKSKRDKADESKAETETKPAEPAKEPKTDAKKGAGGDEGEPSFDALLKEAGVQDKKPQKVKLDKKSLTGADIKKGMSSVAGKAQACYAGTQGTAQVKLTVNPDGKIAKVSVSGVFAGTPVGACVESAVKGAAFPPWEGGPQSFGYSYLLAE